jgi:hypothetical protein
VAVAAVEVAVWKSRFLMVLSLAVVRPAADLLLMGAVVVSQPFLILLRCPTP